MRAAAAGVYSGNNQLCVHGRVHPTRYRLSRLTRCMILVCMSGKILDSSSPAAEPAPMKLPCGLPAHASAAAPRDDSSATDGLLLIKPGVGGTTDSWWLPVLDVLTPAARGSSGVTADGRLLGGAGGLMSLHAPVMTLRLCACLCTLPDCGHGACCTEILLLRTQSQQV
jgi:hypothetical protein